jgi:hypothetical protein
MTQVDDVAVQTENGSRLGRLPFVLLLTVGLLFSLIHCDGCEFDFANAGTSTVVLNPDHGSVPNVPEQQFPCHCGHCLSHVTVQHFAVVTAPAGLIPRAPSFGQQQSPATLAGLPLFKPPRA